MLENTKLNIVDAAIFIFNEDLSAALEKVAEKAGVTRRTLHRYFKDREDLLRFCNHEMERSCSKAMQAAEQSSDDPYRQLEHMLYAAIDCGAKYAFLHKLHHLHGHIHIHQDKHCKKYDETFHKMNLIIEKLRDKGIISRQLTTEWVSVLFSGLVTSTISSNANGKMDHELLKKFAWHSFSKGISD